MCVCVFVRTIKWKNGEREWRRDRRKKERNGGGGGENKIKDRGCSTGERRGSSSVRASLHLHTQRSPRYNNKMPVNTCFAVHYGPTFDSRASLLHRFRQHPTATVIANYLHALSTRFFSSISLHQNSDHFQIYFPFEHSNRFNFEKEQRSRGHGYRFKCVCT